MAAYTRNEISAFIDQILTDNNNREITGLNANDLFHKVCDSIKFTDDNVVETGSIINILPFDLNVNFEIDVYHGKNTFVPLIVLKDSEGNIQGSANVAWKVMNSNTVKFSFFEAITSPYTVLIVKVL